MEFSEIIPGLFGKDIYIYMTPENPDWISDDSRAEMIIHCKGSKFSLSLSDSEEATYLASSIHHFISPESLILSWSAKDIFSFLKGVTGIPLELGSNIYDLQIICSYFGYPKERPANFKDALGLLRKAYGEPRWKDFKKFYEAVYKPLFSRVVPSMETCPLVDNRRRMRVYPSYVIEGQANGRLKALKTRKESYNPHTLGPDEKRNMRPTGYDDTFVHFDFKNMEVCVLQWLSGDDLLGNILSSGNDPYKEIWRIVSGSEPSDNQRALCKGVFLPVIFGLGKRGLSKKLCVSEKVAGTIIDRLVKSFSAAFDWVEGQSKFVGDTAVDAFGRKRKFEPDDVYKSRNFFIQSPASMICLRKLVRLHDDLSGLARLCFHVHDGYYAICEKSKVDEVSEAGIASLESDEEMFPGLELGTSCSSGQNLHDLQPTKRKVICP
jgi:hypothetical protein